MSAPSGSNTPISGTSWRTEVVARLAEGLAHDLRNLLTIILGTSERLLDELPADSPSREAADTIYQSAARAADLTQRVLAFGRHEEVDGGGVDLNEIVRDSAPLIRTLVGETIDVRVVCGGVASPIGTNRTEIEQVLFNLAVNARDAMPSGGTLEIAVEQPAADATPPQIEPRRAALLSVADTGAGMTEAVLARAREPFYTTKEEGKGTGLGLAIVSSIAHKCGGAIVIDSAEGRGTRVRVYFPLAGPSVDRSADPAPDAAPSRGTETVLLVEDEEDVRELVREMLQEAGYQVLCAKRPSEAERISGEFQPPIHMLLTDVVMPEMNGAQLAGRLSARRADLKVLYMSGYPDHSTTGALPPGVDLMVKPFKKRALLSRVREVLDASRDTTSKVRTGP
jgi:CheY-like chemotaxis protein